MAGIEQILGQWDECALRYRFPSFYGTESRLLSSKLSTFCSSEVWVMAIEWVELSSGYTDWNGLVSWVQVFGNALGVKPGSYEIFRHVEDGAGLQLFSYESPFSGGAGVSINHDVEFCMIRDTQVSIKSIVAELEHGLLDLLSDQTADKFMMKFAREYGHFLWCTEKELVSVCGSNLPPLLLSLDDWWHPDVVNIKLPSDSKSFQQIANCILHNDSSLYDRTMSGNMNEDYWAKFME